MSVNKKITVLVTGAFGNGNFGDDALIYACRDLLSDLIPLSEVAFLAKRSDYLQKLFPDLHFVESINELKSLKWILYGGGTQFSSFENTYNSVGKKLPRILVKILTNPSSILRRVFEIRKSRFVAYAGIGLGVGPFYYRGSDEDDARGIVRSMQFLSVRDALSSELCKSWRINHFIQGADLCYLPNLFECDVKRILMQERQPKELAIIPRDWIHNIQGDAYRAKLQMGLIAISKLGLNITFICFSKKDDAKWIKWLIENNIPYIAWDPLDLSQSIFAFYKRLADFDIYLTARYHGAVFATLQKKPFIAIDIEPKLQQVGNLFKGQARTWGYPFNIQNVVDSVKHIIINYKKIVHDQTAVLNQQNMLAAHQKRLFSIFASENIVKTKDID